MNKLCVALMFLLSACLVQPVHQGNVVKQMTAQQIKVGDSRTQVESVLGEPVLQTLLNNQVIYMEDVQNYDTDEVYQRRVEIRYDRAGTVQSIQHHGFEKQ